MKTLRIILIAVLALGVALLGTGLIVRQANTFPVYVNTWVQTEDAPNAAYPTRIEFFRRGSCDVDGTTLTYKFKGETTVQIGETQYGVSYGINKMTLSDASGSANYVATGSSERYVYKIVDGGAVITDYKGDQNLLVIPSTLGGAPVTRVESGFSDKSFAKIVIPEGVTSIGERAFESCNGLEEVVLPSTLVVIEDHAFYFCPSLTKIELPDALQQIGESVFSQCGNLKGINLPNSLEAIGEGAFSSCKALESIILPEGLTTIDEYTFCDCSALKSVFIPKGVTTIQWEAFEDCESLESIYIPEGVTSIDYNAFSECKALSSVSLPASLTDLHGTAFEDCPNLGEVIIAPESTTYQAVENAILTADGTTLVMYFDGDYKTSYTIPAGVTTIGSYAFSECPTLRLVIVSEGVTTIENGAFYFCEELENVSIPASVTDCNAPFTFCKAIAVVSVSQDNPNYQVLNGLLMSKDGTTLVEYLYGASGDTLVLPEGITSIESNAFYNMDDVDRIVLPKSITTLEDNFSIGESSLEFSNAAIVAPKDSAVYAYAKEQGIEVEASVD